jgi:hypothetical protein
MNEAEWLACTDTALMLEYLRGKAPGHKLRLFAVACCRAVWPMLTDRRSREAVEAAERSCEGTDAEPDFSGPREAAKGAISSGSPGFRPAEQAATAAAVGALDPEPETAARLACGWARNVKLALAYEENSSDLQGVKAKVFERWAAESATLLREVFGNQFPGGPERDRAN